MQKTINNRLIIEDLFANSVKTSEISNKLEKLVNFTNRHKDVFADDKPEIAKIFARINNILQDCESNSLLSLEITWEVTSNLLKQLTQLDYSDTINQLMASLNAIVLSIEDGFQHIYELINMEIEITYSLKNTQLTFNNRFSKNGLLLRTT